MLAGEFDPVWAEIRRDAERAWEQLGIRPIDDPSEARRAYVRMLARRVLMEQLPPRDGLGEIAGHVADLDEDDPDWPLLHLWWAADDVIHGCDTTEYWRA